MLTVEEKETARQLKSYFPFRRVFFCISPDGKSRELLCKPDRRMANNRLRKGWQVQEVEFRKY